MGMHDDYRHVFVNNCFSLWPWHYAMERSVPTWHCKCPCLLHSHIRCNRWERFADLLLTALLFRYVSFSRLTYSFNSLNLPPCNGNAPYLPALCFEIPADLHSIPGQDPEDSATPSVLSLILSLQWHTSFGFQLRSRWLSLPLEAALMLFSSSYRNDDLLLLWHYSLSHYWFHDCRIVQRDSTSHCRCFKSPWLKLWADHLHLQVVRIYPVDLLYDSILLLDHHHCVLAQFNILSRLLF